MQNKIKSYRKKGVKKRYIKGEKKDEIFNKFTNRLKKVNSTYKKVYRRKFKKQKRFAIMFKTVKVYNKFFEVGGTPEFRKNWKIRKPFFLMSFFFKRYIKRYYGRLRNNKMGFIYNLIKKRSDRFGYKSFNYFQVIESVLSVFLTRIGAFKSPIIAKDFIKQGFVFINGKVVLNPNYILKMNDLVSFDNSLFKDFLYKPYSKSFIYHIPYIRRKMFYKKYRIRGFFLQESKSRDFLFFKKRYNVLRRFTKYLQYIVFSNNQWFLKVYFKIFLKFLSNRAIFDKAAFLVKNRRKRFTSKLRTKFIFKLKRHKVLPFRNFLRTRRPYNKYMPAGLGYRTRIRGNRFFLNVEYSFRINKFIFIRKPIFENVYMHTMNRNAFLKSRKSPVLEKALLNFFLDNHRKSII